MPGIFRRKFFREGDRKKEQAQNVMACWNSRCRRALECISGKFGGSMPLCASPNPCSPSDHDTLLLRTLRGQNRSFAPDALARRHTHLSGTSNSCSKRLKSLHRPIPLLSSVACLPSVTFLPQWLHKPPFCPVFDRPVEAKARPAECQFSSFKYLNVGSQTDIPSLSPWGKGSRKGPPTGFSGGKSLACSSS